MDDILTIVSEYFDYICIVVAFILARYSSQEYRAIAYILLAEFSAHKLAYIFGIQLTSFLNPSGIYLAYIAIELLAIVAMLRFQSHFAITALIFINLTYNMLTISQYVIPTYDFYGAYKVSVQSIMILELVYLAWITAYVAAFRREHGFINTNHIDRLFRVRRRVNNGLCIQGLAR